MVILDKSFTSVLHTTNESILKPLAAKCPDTEDKTPGSFCTKQLSTCCFLGALLGKGVSYKIDDTAASADQFGVSNVGKGGLFRFLCKVLYANADVDEDSTLCLVWSHLEGIPGRNAAFIEELMEVK